MCAGEPLYVLTLYLVCKVNVNKACLCVFYSAADSYFSVNMPSYSVKFNLSLNMGDFLH